MFLVLGAAMLVLAFTAGGQAASSSIAGLVVSLMWGVALLGPWIARGGVRVLGAPLRRLSPIAGDLAATSARAAAVRMAAVITPIALALSFGGTQLFAQTTSANATSAEAREGMHADRVLTSSGPGVPHAVYEAAKEAAGRDRRDRGEADHGGDAGVEPRHVAAVAVGAGLGGRSGRRHWTRRSRPDRWPG